MYFWTQAIAITSNSNKCFGYPQHFFLFVFDFHTFFSLQFFPFSKHAMIFFDDEQKIQNNDFFKKKGNRTNDNIKRPLKKRIKIQEICIKNKGKEKCCFAHLKSKIFYFLILIQFWNWGIQPWCVPWFILTKIALRTKQCLCTRLNL